MKLLRGVGLSVRAIAGLALLVFLGLLAWELLANFWALGIGGMGIVALVLVTLYVLGSREGGTQVPAAQAELTPPQKLLPAPSEAQRKQLAAQLATVLSEVARRRAA